MVALVQEAPMRQHVKRTSVVCLLVVVVAVVVVLRLLHFLHVVVLLPCLPGHVLHPLLSSCCCSSGPTSQLYSMMLMIM